MIEAHLRTRFAVHLAPEMPEPLSDEFSLGYWLPLRPPVQAGVEDTVRECLQEMIAAHAVSPMNNRVAGIRCNVLSSIRSLVPIDSDERLTQAQLDEAYLRGWIPFTRRVGYGAAVPWGIGSGKPECVSDILECLVVQQFLHSVVNTNRQFKEDPRLYYNRGEPYFYAFVLNSLYERRVRGVGREELRPVPGGSPEYFTLNWSLNFPLRKPVHLSIVFNQEYFKNGGKPVLAGSQNLPAGHRKFLPDFDDLEYVDTTNATLHEHFHPGQRP